jgi:hypothetical protein
MVTPIAEVRLFEVCSHSPCTALPPSVRGVAANFMYPPGWSESLSMIVNVTDRGVVQS